jgi:MFS family permease
MSTEYQTAFEGVEQVEFAATRPSVWRNRDFLLLWSGQGVSSLGSSITDLALPLLVLAMTDSPAQAGFVTAVGTAPNLIFSLLAGALVDRWDRKLVMIACDLVRFLALCSVPVAYALGFLTLGQLYMVAAIQGTSLVFFGLAQFSCLPNVVSQEQVARASSLNEAAESGALLLGPCLAGAIINLARTIKAGVVLACLADGISYLVSVVALLCIRIPFEAERQQEAAAPLFRQIGEGLHYLWGKTGLRAMVLTATGIMLFTGPLYLSVIMLARSIGANAFTIGLTFSVASVGGLAGAFVAPWLLDRVGKGKIIILTALVPALLLPVLATATTYWVLMLGWTIIELTVPFFNIAQVSYRVSVVPDVVLGRVSSVFRMLGFGGVVLGTSLGGVLLDHIGPRPVFWIMAAGLALTTVLVSLTEIRHA